MRSSRFRRLLILTGLVLVAIAGTLAADRVEPAAEVAAAEKPKLNVVAIEEESGATMIVPTYTGLMNLLEKGGLEPDPFTPAGGTPQCPAVWVCGVAPCGESGPQGCLWRGTMCSASSSCNDVDTGLTACQVGSTGLSCTAGKTIHTRTCSCEGCPSSTCFDGCAGATQRTLICK